MDQGLAVFAAYWYRGYSCNPAAIHAEFLVVPEDESHGSIRLHIGHSQNASQFEHNGAAGTVIVCGLTVKPDPCDTRSVIVSPGYAIECCGNDILVSCPETIDIILIDRPELPPTGAGEASTRPTAGALANAIFDATGIRLRSLPMVPNGVKLA